jgi:hypothetical protein
VTFIKAPLPGIWTRHLRLGRRVKHIPARTFFYSSPKRVNFGKLFQTHVTWGGGATPPPHVTCVVVAIPIPDPEKGLFEQCKQGSSPSAAASRTVYWLSGWSLSHISVNWTVHTRWHFLWCVRNERCKIRNVHVNWTNCNEMWYWRFLLRFIGTLKF